VFPPYAYFFLYDGTTTNGIAARPSPTFQKLARSGLRGGNIFRANWRLLKEPDRIAKCRTAFDVSLEKLGSRLSIRRGPICVGGGIHEWRVAMRIETVCLFDLDSTLADSVYQHVLAWKATLDAEGIELSVWRIHREIGESRGLLSNQLLRETGPEMSAERVEQSPRLHVIVYDELIRRGDDVETPFPWALIRLNNGAFIHRVFSFSL
jgi:hypothetical protein